MDDDAVNERYRDLIEARYLLELRGPLGLAKTWIDAVTPKVQPRAVYQPRPAGVVEEGAARFPDRRLRFFAARDLEVGELTFDF